MIFKSNYNHVALNFHDMVYIGISAVAEKLVKNYLTMISFKNLFKKLLSTVIALTYSSLMPH